MININGLLITVLLKLTAVICDKNKIECGYKQCPQTRDGALNVHLIAHSHMDAGWVKTFDEYYYGTKTTISTANVRLIYHSVLSELLHDSRRKFTFSESSYFWRWWKEQRPATRATFRSLVQEGRVEFAGGGYVQNDEAAADYLQVIDQYTWGLRKINDTLGQCGRPKAAWQIDTYGHTREQVSLLAQMGYDGLFIGRIDHKQREAMIEEDRMDFIWRGSDVLGKMSDIMTHTLFNLYNAPEGFCFDFLCNDEPIVDDPDNSEYNADRRVNDFIAQIEKQAKYYEHDNIIVTMGGDFTHQSAAGWFMNMDKLINHVNTHPANLSDINIFYSTPSCYLKSIYLYGKRDKAIYTERNDFIPYGSDPQTYWTGFYTSRPCLKYMVRRAHVFLQVAKQLSVISRTSDSYELHLLRHAVSLVLHHDGITGTSQQHVANDFMKILSDALDTCSRKVSSMLSLLTPSWGGGNRRTKNSQHFVTCHTLNMSQCKFTETQDTMMVLVYNPLSTKTYFHIRLPTTALHFTIKDYNDEEVEYQLVPLPAAVINLPGRTSTAIQELCFEAENIPPLGNTAFYIASVRDQLEENEFTKKLTQGKLEGAEENVTFISNEYIKVSVDKTTGLLSSIQHVDGIVIDVTQNFHYYPQNQQNQQSGVYAFRPDKNRPVPVSDKATYYTVRGSLVKEIQQRFNEWVSQTIRLYRGEEFVELEWVVGPVPIGTDLGKEVVSIFTTNITNHGEFFTDSNGRQMMTRTCMNKSGLGQSQKKSLPSCYYPVTSRICIHSHNSSLGMCVLPDRTEGGTSYNDGEIELMVHRRLLTDDGFGLEEALNEEAHGVGLVVRGKHRIFFGNSKQEVEELTFSERVAASARRWQYEPSVFFTPGDKLNRRKWQTVRNKRFSALKLHGLPRHVNVLTLEPWKQGAVLLRLENTLEQPIRERFRMDKFEDPGDYNAAPSHVTVELRKIFQQMSIKRVRETTLAANQWLDDARQMDWSSRYIYNGGDDHLLPEDAEVIEDELPKLGNERRTDPTSDEEFEQPRQYRSRHKPHLKGRKMTKNYDRYDYNNRRKRSINVTETNYNDNENIEPKLTNNDRMKNEFNITENEFNVINEGKTGFNVNNAVMVNVLNGSVVGDIRNEIDELAKEAMMTVSTAKTDAAEVEERIQIKATLKTPILNLHSHRRPNSQHQDMHTSHIYRDMQISDEIEERIGDKSEENFSSNLKKKAQEKSNEFINRNQKKQEPIVEVTDDVTKSMYDMYFRQLDQCPARNYKKQKRNNEKTTGYLPFFFKNERTELEFSDERRGREKRDTSKVYGSWSKGKIIPNTGGIPEYSEEDFTEHKHRRFKRHNMRKDENDLPDVNHSESTEEPDFVITLRPTQIRTFVIWFHDNHRH